MLRTGRQQVSLLSSPRLRELAVIGCREVHLNGEGLSRCCPESPPTRISVRSPRLCGRSPRRSAEQSNLRPRRSRRLKGPVLFVPVDFDSRASAALDEPASYDVPRSQPVQTYPKLFGAHPTRGQSGLNIQLRDQKYPNARLDPPRRVVQPPPGPKARQGV